MLRFVLLLAAAASASAQGNPSTPQLMLRLAEEAEAFGRLAAKVIGQEALEQVALVPPPRFQARGEKPPLAFKTRHIESEYGFSIMQADAQNLHEVRQVLSVDGKKVKAPGKLRETLSMGLQGDSDKMKKKLLKEFEGYGLREVATDLGQMILLFTQRQIANYTFTPLRQEFLGADKCLVFHYEQNNGDSAMTVFEGKRVVRHKLNGEVWLRAQDGLPLRITLAAARLEKDVPLSHLATVDYQQTPYGLILPVSVHYAESVAGQIMVENRFKYTDFKMFGASSDVKFTVEDELVKK